MNRVLSVFVLLLAVNCGAAVVAQENGDRPSERRPRAEDQRPPAPLNEGDPTRPRPDLRDLLEENGAMGRAAAAPELALKGVVLSSGRAPKALMQINGRILVIEPDSRIDVGPPGGTRMILRVLRIRASGVELEFEGLGQSFSVNY